MNNKNCKKTLGKADAQNNRKTNIRNIPQLGSPAAKLQPIHSLLVNSPVSVRPQHYIFWDQVLCKNARLQNCSKMLVTTKHLKGRIY